MMRDSGLLFWPTLYMPMHNYKTNLTPCAFLQQSSYTAVTYIQRRL